MEKIFGPGGVLASHLPGYEPRPGQRQMAEAVAAALEDPDRGSLVVEAETGLGKTLAYLVPAVLSGRKVVVSTNTRNLQDQILKGEIPFIREYIYPGLKALCVKGRQNYLCLYRWHQYRAAGQNELFDDREGGRIAGWLMETEFGDRSELQWLAAGSPVWQKICCQQHFCLGNDCPDGSACFLNRLRREAAKSDLLIVNHHLFFSDLAVRRSGYGEVLPRYEAVIFDEAHHIEEVATTFFGFSFTRYQVLDLAADVERSALSELAGSKQKQQAALKAARAVSGQLEQFFSLFPPEKGRFPLDDILAARPDIGSGRDHLISGLNRLADAMEGLAGRDEPWGQYEARALDLAARLEAITAERFSDSAGEEISSVHWYERREKNFVLSSTPIDVADDLRDTLYAMVQSTVFTSATLSTQGDFSYFMQRLGLPEHTGTMSFPSPFDYAGRSLLYVPDKSFPEPNAPGYATCLHERIGELVRLSRGRALVLFTSNQAMDRAYAALRDSLDYPLFVQGEASRHQLLSRFARQRESVLFAVSSFWEGVDIRGDSLSMVIIDKLPFEVPTDPVIMARINRIRALGSNPFFDFQVPRAILSLRQGVGRLMRSTGDRGVMAVLDVRLFTKGYGRRFLQSLPPSPLCRELERVETFFAEEGKQHEPG
ncbi:MAG: ATP-dependent DNA helicase [Desulfobulbaceae bacterium]|nr:ATP-dependent DNA helicase [Desulfobulbaceae bacterium]